MKKDTLSPLKKLNGLLSLPTLSCTKGKLYPSMDKTRDIRSNIPLCLKEFLRAKPEGTSEGEGVYLTVYPESSPYMESI